MLAHLSLRRFAYSVLVLQVALFAACGDDDSNGDSTSNASLTGAITSTVSCPATDTNDDCQGTVYVGLFAEADLTNPALVSVALNDVDLSAGGPVTYTLEDLEPGVYFLAAFLDENGDASPSQPLPEAGDLVSATGMVQVSVEALQATQSDLLLDLRIPDGSADPCDEVLCGDHSTCQVDAGSGTCVCDAGYIVEGTDCVAEVPLPPSDLSCPAPACAGDPLCDQWMDKDWYYASNNASCSVGSVLLFHFAADGTFWFRHEYDTSGGSQNFMYGCWSMTASDASRVTLAYDYANTSTFNCLSPGRMNDPPCTAVLEQTDADTWFQGDAWDAYSERHVFRSLGQACDWCSDDAACCPEPGWVEDSSGALCP